MAISKDSKNLAFLFYAQDFVTDTATWTAEEVGYYIRLLCLQWINGSIDSDPNRLANGVGNGVLSVWTKISTKFVMAENGELVNLRLERERQKVYNYLDTQSDNGKKGAAKRWGRHSDPNGGAISEPNRVANSVAYANTNTNSNTVYKKGNRDFGNGDPNGDPINSEKKFFAAAEKIMQVGPGRFIKLQLYLDGGFTSAEISKLLEGNLERMVMVGELHKKPDDYLIFLFESYFTETISSGQESSAGKINKDFMFWYNNCMKRIDKQYNESKKSVDWFQKELIAANGVCKNEIARKNFSEYYLTPMPSGKAYFQTLHNFNLKESLTKWVKDDYKTISKLKIKSGTTVLPGDGHTIDELNDYYKQE